MFTAKIIRHRHQTQSILNDRINHIDHEDHFKVIFSHPKEMEAFMKWCKDNGGEYKYNRANNIQEGELPEKIKDLFPEDVGWCDLATYFLLHVAGYLFYSTIDGPYKGEVYVRYEIPKEQPI